MVEQDKDSIEEHVVSALENPVRLSDYAGGQFTSIPSRKGMKKAIDQGRVLCDGKTAKTATLLHGGEQLSLLANPAVDHLPQVDLKLRILWEDDAMAILYKPAGILVSGNKRFTVRNALRNNLQPSSAKDALQLPEPAHRLDYDTTGCLLVGKTAAALMHLNKALAQGSITKTYLCVCQGLLPERGSIEKPIDGKEARTHFRRLAWQKSERFEQLNLVAVQLETGRTHQIRKHFSGMGCPLLADAQYGTPGKILQGKSIYLHAYQLQLAHPITQEPIKVSAPPPKKFRRLFPEAINELAIPIL